MSKVEDVCWLDGYLKGLIDSRSGLRGRFVACARLLQLPGTDMVAEYMRVANDITEEGALGVISPPLLLAAENQINDWIVPVTEDIHLLFSKEKNETVVSMVVGEVLDMIDGILAEVEGGAVYCAMASMESYKGRYLFFELGRSEYLIISFMQNKAEQ